MGMRDFEKKLLENARAFKEFEKEGEELKTKLRNCESRVRQAMTQIIRHQSQDAYNNALSDITELKRLAELKSQLDEKEDRLVSEARELF